MLHVASVLFGLFIVVLTFALFFFFFLFFFVSPIGKQHIVSYNKHLVIPPAVPFFLNNELKICVELIQGLSLFCGLILYILWVAMVLPTHPTYHDLSLAATLPQRLRNQPRP